MEEDTGEAAKDRMRWVRAYVPYINKRKKKHFCHNHIYSEDNCWYLFMQSDQSRNYVTAKNCFLIILTHGAKHTHFDQEIHICCSGQYHAGCLIFQKHFLTKDCGHKIRDSTHLKCLLASRQCSLHKVQLVLLAVNSLNI